MAELVISPAAARVNAGLSQKEAAEKLKITPETLRSYEKGVTVPDWNTVMDMERYYGIPAKHIFFGKHLAISEEDSPPPDRP